MKRIAILIIVVIQTICVIAQQVGSKVSFPAVDGKMYTGTITEIRGNQYKIKYDGFNFEAWLYSNQFTVISGTSTSTPGITSATSAGTTQILGRNELSVFFAGMTGLGTAWGRAATEPFTMSAEAISAMQGVLGNARDALNMVRCVGFDISKLNNLISRLPSLSNVAAVAEIEAIIRELQGIIANVQLDCGNGATLSSLYVSAVHLGAAQAWASSRICRPTPMPVAIQTVIRNHLITARDAYAGFLPCTPGVSLSQFNSIPLGSLNSTEPHTHIVGLHTNLLWNIALSNCSCTCIDKNTTTTAKCWPGSHAAVNPQTNKTECYCDPGLFWNGKTACVTPEEIVRNTDCSKYPGSYAAWNAQTQKAECYCPAGKKWNSTMTACIDATTSDGGGGGGGGGTGNWTLVSTTVTPQTPSRDWSYNAQSSSASMTIYNGTKADFQWTAPPQQFNSNGFTISLSAQAKPVQNDRGSALIGVSAYGLTSDIPADQQSAYAKSENIGVSSTAQKSVTFKPNSNTGDIEVIIDIMWGAVKYTYKYKRM